MKTAPIVASCLTKPAMLMRNEIQCVFYLHISRMVHEKTRSLLAQYFDRQWHRPLRKSPLRCYECSRTAKDTVGNVDAGDKSRYRISLLLQNLTWFKLYIVTNWCQMVFANRLCFWAKEYCICLNVDRHLFSGALQMILQYQCIFLDFKENIFDRFIKQSRWMPRVKLIEWIPIRNDHRKWVCISSSCTARLLPLVVLSLANQ